MNRRMKRTGLLMVLILAAEVLVCYHYNSLFSGHSAPTARTDAQPTSTVESSRIKGIQLDSEKLICVSPDGTQVSWIDAANKLHVANTSDGKEVYQLQLEYTPDYLTFIRDSNLMIGTEASDASGKDIRLSTIYTVGNNQPRLIKDFSGFSSDSTLEKISFSPYTNDTYIVIGNSTNSVVYHFDTNGNMNPVSTGGRTLYDISVTSTTAKVYIQDFAAGTKNVLVLDDTNGDTSLIQLNAALLGMVQNKMYYGLLDNSGNVTAVNTYTGNGPGQPLLSLPQPTSPQNVFIDGSGHVLVINGDTVENLTTKKTRRFASGDTFLNTGNALCILSADGSLQIMQ